MVYKMSLKFEIKLSETTRKNKLQCYNNKSVIYVEDTHIDRKNRIDSPEIDAHKYSQLTFDNCVNNSMEG